MYVLISFEVDQVAAHVKKRRCRMNRRLKGSAPVEFARWMCRMRPFDGVDEHDVIRLDPAVLFFV